jgi:AraC-like DNA-binding protein
MKIATEMFLLQAATSTLRQRLAQPERELFRELTGLKLHVFWHTPLDWSGLGTPQILCPCACQQYTPANRPTDCCLCSQERWNPFRPSATEVWRVEGLCGCTSLCAAVRARQTCPVTLVAQPDSGSGPEKRGVSVNPLMKKARFKPACRWPNSQSAAFGRAESLLSWLQRDLETILHAWLTEAGLNDASTRLRHLEAENARLRKELYRRVPEVTVGTPVRPFGNRAQQIVEAMLDYARQHYQRPMGLAEVAADLRMDPAYLCSLFSKTVGVTSHEYLEELRLAKAEKLLRQASARVCEVACAVGYTSSNHFRDVFKAHTGLSPMVWRQT